MDKGPNGNGVSRIENKWQAAAFVASRWGVIASLAALFGWFMYGVYDLYVSQLENEKERDKRLASYFEKQLEMEKERDVRIAQFFENILNRCIVTKSSSDADGQ